jgi:hypothetical protein
MEIIIRAVKSDGKYRIETNVDVKINKDLDIALCFYSEDRGSRFFQNTGM